MKDKFSHLLNKTKTECGFPSQDRIDGIMNDFQENRVWRTGDPINSVSRVILEDIRAVLKKFTDFVIENSVKLDLKSNEEIESVVNDAAQAIFTEGRGLIVRVFRRSIWRSHETKAMGAIEEGRRPITEYLHSIIAVRDLASTSSAVPTDTPLTRAPKSFSFISDTIFRNILERDYLEIQQAFSAKCWKSVIILSGSAIEAVLLDCLLLDQTKALSAQKAPLKKQDIKTWDLSEIINVCLELGVVSSNLEKLSHTVREYRNLVHPGNEARTKLKFGEEEATIAFQVLNIVHRELNKMPP